MRINKYLAECGVCSRRKADEYVKAGRVSVNKKIVREVGSEIDENKDVVYVDGKKVVHITHYDYIMFNKPKGCVTTMDDTRDDKSGRIKIRLGSVKYRKNPQNQHSRIREWAKVRSRAERL